MSPRSGWWPAILAAAMAAGCAGRTTTLEVWAVAHDGGARVEIKKDREHHDSAVVSPGDRIAFVCRECPEGAEFAVEDIHFLGDLDDLADVMLRTGLTDPARLDAMIEEVARAAAGPAAAEAGAPEAANQASAGKGVADTTAALRDLRSVFARPAADGDHGPPLFENWAPGGFAPARDAIVSGRVGPLTHAGLWKFTWRVRLPGGAEDKWDPHIYGHPDRDY